MKNLWLILMAVAMSCSFRVKAQDKSKLEDFAFWRTIEWNIDKKRLTEVDLRNPTAAKVIRKDTVITKRPNNPKVALVVIRPRELGFKFGHRHTDFVKKVIEIGFKPVPRWVPVQLYAYAYEFEKKLCFCDDEGKGKQPYYCLEKTAAHGYYGDIFTETPFGDPRIGWVFAWPGSQVK